MNRLLDLKTINDDSGQGGQLSVRLSTSSVEVPLCLALCSAYTNAGASKSVMANTDSEGARPE